MTHLTGGILATRFAAVVRVLAASFVVCLKGSAQSKKTIIKITENYINFTSIRPISLGINRLRTAILLAHALQSPYITTLELGYSLIKRMHALFTLNSPVH